MQSKFCKGMKSCEEMKKHTRIRSHFDLGIKSCTSVQQLNIWSPLHETNIWRRSEQKVHTWASHERFIIHVEGPDLNCLTVRNRSKVTDYY